MNGSMAASTYQGKKFCDAVEEKWGIFDLGRSPILAPHVVHIPLVGVDIRKVPELLGHRHVTTTQIYDKRRRTTNESPSHDVPV